MKEQTTYKLSVKRPIELLNNLLEVIPFGSLLSLEGNLNKVINPMHLHSTEEQGVLKRNTITPKQDFWIFHVNQDTVDYLRNDLFKRVGIRSNVIHILIAYDDKVIFAAYDNFDDDCVSITPSTFITEEVLSEFVDKKIIRRFEKIND